MFTTTGSRISRKRVTGSNLSLPLVGNGLTYTISTPLLNLSQTWNNVATTFTGLKFNVTNTASASASLVLDLEVGGVSQFRVTTTGGTIANFYSASGNPSTGIWSGMFADVNSVSLAIANLVGNSGTGFYVQQATTPQIAQIPNSFAFSWSSTTVANGAGDTYLHRDAANIIAQRNSATAQGFRVYNTADLFPTTTNYERAVFDWTTTANTLTIATQNAGTGTARNIAINTAGGGLNIVSTPSLTIVEISLTGSLAHVFDDTSGVTRSRIGVGGTSGIAGPSIQLDNTGVIGFTGIAQTGNYDAGVSRTGPRVIAFGDGLAPGNTNGFFQWGGQARPTANFTSSTSTLTAITGLSSVVIGSSLGTRNYSFEAWLTVTGSSLAGCQIGITCSSSTITTLASDGFMLDAGVIRGSSVGVIASTGTPVVAVSSATTTSSNPSIRINGMIRVASSGLFGLTLAQSTASATQTIVSSASWMLVYDMP